MKFKIRFESNSKKKFENYSKFISDAIRVIVEIIAVFEKILVRESKEIIKKKQKCVKIFE